MDDNCFTTVGHEKADSTDEYIGRTQNNGTMRTKDVGEYGWLGNPYVEVDNATDDHIRDPTIDIVPNREAAISEFRAEFVARICDDAEFRNAVRDLSGGVIGGWCRRVDDDGPPCHGDVIADIADLLAVYEHTTEEHYVAPTWRDKDA